MRHFLITTLTKSKSAFICIIGKSRKKYFFYKKTKNSKCYERKLLLLFQLHLPKIFLVQSTDISIEIHSFLTLFHNDCHFVIKCLSLLISLRLFIRLASLDKTFKTMKNAFPVCKITKKQSEGVRVC